jgi:hypothetical protein
MSGRRLTRRKEARWVCAQAHPGRCGDHGAHQGTQSRPTVPFDRHFENPPRLGPGATAALPSLAAAGTWGRGDARTCGRDR